MTEKPTKDQPEFRVIDPDDCTIGVLILMRDKDPMHNLKCAMYLAKLFENAEHGEEAFVVAIPPDLAIPTIQGVAMVRCEDNKPDPWAKSEDDPMPTGLEDFLRRCTPRGRA